MADLTPGNAIRARARALLALRESVALVAVLAMIGVVATAFVWPWLPQPPTGGDWIAHYAPLRDDDARLAVRTDGDGSPDGWLAQNSRLIPGLRVATDLRQNIANAFLDAARRDGETAIPDGEMTERLASLTVVETRSYDLNPDGEVLEAWQYSARDQRGDLFVGIRYPKTDQDLLLDPPALALPSSAEPGDTWHSEGKAGSGSYTSDGRLVSSGPYEGPAGRFDDCVQVETHFVLVTPTAHLENPSLDWYCAGRGWVEGQTLNPDGSLKQRSTILSASGGLTSESPLPPAQVMTHNVDGPADPEHWRMLRLGRVRPTGETTEASVLPTWLPTDPPIVLAAGFGSDLVAFETATPGAPPRWRFHTGGTVYGQPAYDQEAGRIYFGSSDKHVYALDTRGLFLWSFETQDNVAARPLVVGDLVVAASEDGTLYGLDAKTGAQQWDFEAGGGIASWPALVEGTVAFGSDDQTVYGVDPSTGALQWTLPASGAVEAPIVASPDDGTVYVASRDGTLAAFSPSDCADECSPRWSVKPGESLRSAPLVVGALVVVIDSYGQMIAVRAEDGRRAWTLADGNHPYAGAPILVGDAIVASTSNGLVDRVSLDGVRLGQWDARKAMTPADGDPSFAYGPTLGGGDLWLLDGSGVLRRLGAPSLGEIPCMSLAWLDTAGRPPIAGSQLRTTVAEHAGQAVVVDVNRGVIAIDPATGAGSKIADLPGEGVLSQVDPVVAGDTLLTVSGKTIQALNLTSRQIQWQGVAPGTAFRPPTVTRQASYGQASSGQTGAGQAVLWVTSGEPDASLLALDLATGAMRWQATLGPITQIGGVVAGADSAYTSTPPAAWDLRTGAPRWRTPLAGVTVGGPALASDGQTLFVGGVNAANTGGMVAALDAATGAVRWQVDLDNAVINPLDQLWAVDDLVVVPDLGGKVIVLDAGTGAERWRFTPPTGRLGNVTVARGQVWLMLDNSRLYGLDLHNGRPTARLSDLELSLNGQGLTQRPTFVGDRLLFPAGLNLIAANLPEDAP
jgi:outer membrane protein assembly factor BamB